MKEIVASTAADDLESLQVETASTELHPQSKELTETCESSELHFL